MNIEDMKAVLEDASEEEKLKASSVALCVCIEESLRELFGEDRYFMIMLFSGDQASVNGNIKPQARVKALEIALEAAKKDLTDACN